MAHNEVYKLPGLLQSSVTGEASWKRLGDIDFEVVGQFLSCHLVIDYYMGEFLIAFSLAPFNWEGAKLTLGQKVSLISGLQSFPESYSVPAILKYFNSLRNKMSHDVDFRVSLDVFLPEIEFLNRLNVSDPPLQLESIVEVLGQFTSSISILFATLISHCSEQKRNGHNGEWML